MLNGEHSEHSERFKFSNEAQNQEHRLAITIYDHANNNATYLVRLGMESRFHDGHDDDTRTKHQNTEVIGGHIDGFGLEAYLCIAVPNLG